MTDPWHCVSADECGHEKSDELVYRFSFREPVCEREFLVNLWNALADAGVISRYRVGGAKVSANE